MLHFDGAGVSDRGPVRELNEDSGFLGPRLVLVADGVGGAAAGEVASASAAYVVARTAGDGADPLLALDAGVRRAAELMDRVGLEDPSVAGMATTLTAIATDGARAALVHLGDSRAWLLRAHGMTRLTRDHTYVQQLVDDGFLAPDAVARHPWRHVVTRSLRGGVLPEDEQPDYVELALMAGDRLVLGTDGLSDHLAEDRIAELAAIADPGEAAQELVDAAILAGGHDNITCLVVDVRASDEVPPPGEGQRFGAFADKRTFFGALRLTR